MYYSDLILDLWAPVFACDNKANVCTGTSEHFGTAKVDNSKDLCAFRYLSANLCSIRVFEEPVGDDICQAAALAQFV